MNKMDLTAKLQSLYVSVEDRVNETNDSKNSLEI